MERREALKYVATLLGGAFSTPTLLAMNSRESGIFFNDSLSPFKLSEMEQKIVAEVAEMIIPKTDTAGAKEAGVPAFIEMMLADCYKQPEQTVFTEGVQNLLKSGFLTQNQEEKTATLKKIEAEAKAKRQGITFWRLIKELTLLGYFTSEIGVKSSFEYVQIPSKFELIKLKPNQKAYAY
jgi:Gluconate 2-dehydrogenase subunit 3